MSIVAVLGAKGGVGSSLVATNLGAILARAASTLLVDLHSLEACDDLYLNLNGEKGWQDLLPVAGELSAAHLERVVRWHPTGLGLIASTGAQPRSNATVQVTLLKALRLHARWVVLDVDHRSSPLELIRNAPDLALIVATPDPPSLRAAARLRSELLDESPQIGLVLNQLTAHHPASPADIAGSLEVPLAGCIWRDPRAAAYQVNFGELPDQPVGRGIAAAVRQLSTWIEERAGAPAAGRAVKGP